MKRRRLQLLMAGMTLVCAATAQHTAPPGSHEAVFRARYEDLNRGIYGAKELPPPAEYEAITARLRETLAEQIQAALSRSEDTPGVMKAISSVQGKLALSEWDPGVTNTPFAERFEIEGKPGLAVAFVILRGGVATPDTLPVLQFYTKERDEWKLRAEADTDLHGCSLMVSSLDSPIPRQSWWLVWGQRFGDTGARRHLRLYSFDGDSLSTLWALDDLSAGDVTVDKDRRTIVLEYYRPVGTPENPRPPLRIREEWVLTTEGPRQASSAILGDAASYRRPM